MIMRKRKEGLSMALLWMPIKLCIVQGQRAPYFPSRDCLCIFRMTIFAHIGPYHIFSPASFFRHDVRVGANGALPCPPATRRGVDAGNVAWSARIWRGNLVVLSTGYGNHVAFMSATVAASAALVAGAGSMGFCRVCHVRAVHLCKAIRATAEL